MESDAMEPYLNIYIYMYIWNDDHYLPYIYITQKGGKLCHGKYG